MKKIILSLLICVSGNLVSQNIKTYTGSRLFYDGLVNGTETYTYIENNGDKFRAGSYNYSGDFSMNNYNSYTGKYEGGKIDLSILGFYTNNKPDKLWTAKISGNVSSSSTDFNLICTCSYENGMLNGKWNSRGESQQRNKNGTMEVIECSFKNNKIVGKYTRRTGIKGTINPDYTCMLEFDKNGFLNNEYYKNGFSLYERNFAKYDTSINSLFLNDTLFVAENRGYIDLNKATCKDILGVDNNCFAGFETSSNFIFQVAGDLPKIYVTRVWIVPQNGEVEALIREYEKTGFKSKASKIEYYYNLSQGFQYTKKELYRNAKNCYLKSLAYKDDTDVRKKIERLQTLINFDSLVSSADMGFKRKQYNEAELLYQKALTIRADKGVEGMLVKINTINEKYSQFIVIAEAEYKNEKPEAAKSNFEQALSFKPNEQYPKDFIQKIEDEKYNKLVKNAENEYKNEKFEISKSYFEQALSVKPNEKFPKDFILKIDNENSNTRSTADSLFRLKDFDNALLSFKQSLKYNSNNNKSKEKIRDIEKTNNDIFELNIKIDKKKLELESVLGRVLKKVYVSVNSYFENKLSAEKDIFLALPTKNEFYNALNKIEALEVTKDKEIQRQLKDVETAEEYLKILGV